MNDANMFQFARKVNSLLELNLSEFVSYDSMFAAPFVSQFETQIDSAEGIEPDWSIKAQQKSAGIEAKKRLNACKENHQMLKRFVLKAFPGNPAKLKSFGIKKYIYAQRSRMRMELFMRDVHSIALINKTELNAVNYSDAMIDEIRTLGLSLGDGISAHSIKKGARPSKNQGRIKSLNEVYAVAADICSAGKFIFRNNPAKYKMFVIHPGQTRLRNGQERKKKEEIKIADETPAPE